MGTAVRVLIVDDYAPWRSFESSILDSDPGFQIVGEAADGKEAIEHYEESNPDLILLDINLPLLNGIEVTRRIKAISNSVKIVIVSEIRLGDIAAEAFRAGAEAYVLKSEAAKELLLAIRYVLSGKQFLSGNLTRS